MKRAEVWATEEMATVTHALTDVDVWQAGFHRAIREVLDAMTTTPIAKVMITLRDLESCVSADVKAYRSPTDK